MKTDIFYYKFKENIFISFSPIKLEGLLPVQEEVASGSFENIFILREPRNYSDLRLCYTLDETNLWKDENLDLINSNSCSPCDSVLPSWIMQELKEDRVFSLNISNPHFKDWFEHMLSMEKKEKLTLTLSGLGDVGGTLLLGLRLLGSDCIETIKIFDLGEDKINRWLFECGQITSPSFKEMNVSIEKCAEDDLFNCDMFIFCVSVGVPKIGDEKEDVRMVQYRGNARVISHYASLARKAHFKGTFAVVSDPVDHLCKAALYYSNLDENGVFDGKGLLPDQISGFGLGVMNARAAFYSKETDGCSNYMTNGRAYGPHGEGLFIANDVIHYDHESSLKLTHLTKTANLAVRETGFKPFIAPALSSGSLSLLSHIRGDWHYSTNFINGAFFGCRNRNICGKVRFESLPLPNELYSSLKDTYKMLKDFDPS